MAKRKKSENNFLVRKIPDIMTLTRKPKTRTKADKRAAVRPTATLPRRTLKMNQCLGDLSSRANLTEEEAEARSVLLKKAKEAMEMMRKAEMAMNMRKKEEEEKKKAVTELWLRKAAAAEKTRAEAKEMMKLAKMAIEMPPSQHVIETTGKHGDADNKKSSKKIKHPPIRNSGFKHLDAEKIMKVVKLEIDNLEKIMYLVQWKNVINPELVSADVMNDRYPFMVVKFYESVQQWSV